MKKMLENLLILTFIVLFFASSLMAGGGGGGRGGGGGGSGSVGRGGGLGGSSGGLGAGGGARDGRMGSGGRDSSGDAGSRAYAGRSGPSAGTRSDASARSPNTIRQPSQSPGGRPLGPTGIYHPYYGGWYHGDWHDHWIRPWYVGPVGWFSLGFATGAVLWDAPWYWGYWPYYNPYYTEVIVIENTPIDYSRPIALAEPASAPPGSLAIADPAVIDNQVAQLLNASRASFAAGDYQAAMTSIDRAIAKKPNDPVLHEFRGLVLFATRQYRAAAATVHAVLAMGPGWDWPTLIGFYPNPDVYTSQLRTLEQYRNGSPDQAEIRFLVAYHYLSCGHIEAAAAELRAVARLNPKDQLSAQLLAGLSADPAAADPAAKGPVLASMPVSAASLVGNWEASRPDGETIIFKLADDMTYSWQYAQKGKSQQYSGAYTLADDVLILKRGGTATMIGQIKVLDGNHFNFKLVGTNASDPGLTFSKK
jgi:tetratricopeptide (TPR) repeat protein